MTISSDPTRAVSLPPLPLLQDQDPTDPYVSFFGHAVKFDGLATVFDASPSAPLFARSDPKNYDPEETHGAEGSGVISGLLDDGQRSWYDTDSTVKTEGRDAVYISSAVGECAGLFRNAAGLLWARISHFNNTLRVRSPLLAPPFDWPALVWHIAPLTSWIWFACSAIWI